MAASASDVRSILSLPNSQTAQPSTPAIRKPSNQTARKPEGISRELYSLIGNATPALIAQYAKPKLKQKPDFGKGKTRWEWRAFTNSARKDGFQLHHWEKVGAQSDYPFAKYNTTTPTYTYSLDEYTRLLEAEDWTKEETDYLFDLVKEYEMRWYVVEDRYTYPEGPTRTIDDLKARYYGVCKKLIMTRPWAGDEAKRETTRKKYVETLMSRTPEQLVEEEALFIEIKRLEQNERRFAKEREDLLRTLLGFESGLASLQTDDDGPVAQVIVVDKKKGKKKVDGIEVDSPSASALSLGPAQSLRKSTTTKSNAYDAQNCIHRYESTNPTPASSKANTTPVYLRSSRLPTPKASKIAGLLDEMGVAYHRLVIPSYNNLQQLRGIFEAGEALLETKKAVDRVEQEIRVLKARLKIREGSEKRSDDAAMDIDEQEMENGEPEAKADYDDDAKGDAEPEAVADNDGAGEDPEVDADEDEDEAEAEAEEVEEDDVDPDAEREDPDEEVDDETNPYAEEEGDAELEMLGEADDDEDLDFMEESKDNDDEESDVQSALGRKRRGLSTSSMDTTGTGTTRRSTKKQKSST